MPFEATPVVVCFDFLQPVLSDMGDITDLCNAALVPHSMKLREWKS
jgi:hypothetical protein